MRARLRFQRLLAAWYPAVILFFTIYLVYGSVASKGSLLLPTLPLVSLLVFSVALFAIFFLEALEVSVIALYAKEHILSQKAMTDFLKGRQLILIMIVFISAQASASPETVLPFTNVAVPPVLALLLFQWGFLGSFLVLWLGQLGGKVIASLNNKAVMEMPPSRVMLKLSILVGGTPLVAASDWFVRQACSIMKINAENWVSGFSLESDAYRACAINSCQYDSFSCLMY